MHLVHDWNNFNRIIKPWLWGIKFSFLPVSLQRSSRSYLSLVFIWRKANFKQKKKNKQTLQLEMFEKQLCPSPNVWEYSWLWPWTWALEGLSTMYLKGLIFWGKAFFNYLLHLIVGMHPLSRLNGGKNYSDDSFIRTRLSKPWLRNHHCSHEAATPSYRNFLRCLYIPPS